MLALSHPVSAAVAERVVAVVGEQAILLSDIRLRARPFLLQLQQKAPSSAQKAAAESEMFKQLIQRMVDERVEQQAAEKAHITVTPEEIDNGLRNVARQQNLTVEQLMVEATKTGLSSQEYRDEVRRQILEGKLLQLRVRSRVRVTDDDVKAVYDRLARLERAKLSYHAAWVVLRVPAGSSAAATAERADLAERIAATARAGRDSQGHPVAFDALAHSFSDDSATRGKGGDLGSHKPGDLAEAIEEQIDKLDVGAVSAPFRFKGDVVVVKLLERETSQLPPLEEAREELMQRAYGEQMEKARKQWIDELRRGLYVDVRL